MRQLFTIVFWVAGDDVAEMDGKVLKVFVGRARQSCKIYYWKQTKNESIYYNRNIYISIIMYNTTEDDKK